MVEPIEREFFTDGLRLHYVEWGDPAHDTLVLVHGIRDQCRSWDFFVTALFANKALPYHVVAPDLRGHGDSGWSSPGRGYQHQDFVLDLTRLLRHLEKGSVTLMGHSLGGNVCILFAGSFPERVKKLVLIEAAGPYARKDEEVPLLLARWLDGEGSDVESTLYPTIESGAEALRARFSLLPERAAGHMAQHGTRATDKGLVWKYDPRIRIPSYSMFSESQVRAFIKRVRCPTLLIYGGEGDLMKQPRSARLALFQSSRMVGIPGSGHHVPHERPDELAKVVAAFLRE